DDNLDSWIDEVAALSQAECKQVEGKLHPVKLILAKVQKLAYTAVYSMTKLLPAWRECLKGLGQPVKLIPHDVRT
ncbi:hypothetical protein BDQ17DRAFT_1256159, partial [Cyathus striatus]